MALLWVARELSRGMSYWSNGELMPGQQRGYPALIHLSNF